MLTATVSAYLCLVVPAYSCVYVSLSHERVNDDEDDDDYDKTTTFLRTQNICLKTFWIC